MSMSFKRSFSGAENEVLNIGMPMASNQLNVVVKDK
jgi:hypothetical protein